MGVVDGGDGGAAAHEVVIAVALQIHMGPGDGVVAVAGDQNTVEILLIAGEHHIPGLGAGDGAVLNQSGDPLFLQHPVVLDDGGIPELLAAAHHQHQAVGRHVVALRHRQHYIPLVGAWNLPAAHPVHGELDKLALRGGETGPLLQRQPVESGALPDQLLAVHDHFSHFTFLLIQSCLGAFGPFLHCYSTLSGAKV